MKKPKLRIGFVLDDGLDKPDGVQQYLLTLGDWFKVQGHSVKYLVGETKRPDLAGVIVMSRNIKVRFNGNGLSIPLFSSVRHIRKVLDKEKFDVIHVQMPYSPLMAARVVKRVSKNVVVIGTFHVLPYGVLPRLGTYLLGFWLKINLKRFNGFISVSSPAKKFARASFGIDSEVLPNPINLDKLRPKNQRPSEENKVEIVFLGRLVRRKGCFELLKALSYIQKNQLSKKKFKVSICGVGPYEQRLKKYAKQNNLEQLVEFKGFILEKEKPDMLAASDIAVFPSLGGESFGIVLLEAMAAQKPVVLGGNNPGYSSVLADFPEALIQPNDTASFARILSDFINDKKLRDGLRTKQQKQIKNYDVSVVGKQILEKYYRFGHNS